MSGRKLAKTFACRTCWKRHTFGVYVAAHTHITLNHTCDRCGAIHSILDYKVTLVEPGKKEGR
jgi:transcription elongation factor Elf1